MGPFKDGWTESDVEAVIERGDAEDLGYVPIVVSMDPPNCDWAESICLRLCTHNDGRVRGNAILGFAHLARTCGKLNRDTVHPIIVAALSDPDSHVRGHAHSAVDDTSHFLGWTFAESEST